MPRRVDHAERRRQIIEAVIRITERGGLQAASFREVAAEAGVSVRLIQYYFGTKADLMLATQRHVGEQSVARYLALVRAAPKTPRETLRAVLTSFVPVDDVSRRAMLMYIALGAATLVDPTLRRREAGELPAGLHGFVAGHLRESSRADIDADREAWVIVAAVPGLCQGVLDGTMSAEAAIKTIEYAIDRALGT